MEELLSLTPLDSFEAFASFTPNQRLDPNAGHQSTCEIHEFGDCKCPKSQFLCMAPKGRAGRSLKAEVTCNVCRKLWHDKVDPRDIIKSTTKSIFTEFVEATWCGCNQAKKFLRGFYGQPCD